MILRKDLKMKSVMTGLAALMLVAGLSAADTTDVKKEAQAVEKTVSAPVKIKADTAKAGMTAKVAAKKTTMEKWVESKTGLKTMDVKVGTGAEAKAGMTVSMHYTGWLWETGAKGKKFDSSVDRNEPFQFALGAGQVIKGWDEGIAGMKEGGKRTLLIPPTLGYGARDVGNGLIPPSSTLLFEVEFLKVVK
jgi:peptidylprolyl isomerase